jgi:hypothetical protein
MNRYLRFTFSFLLTSCVFSVATARYSSLDVFIMHEQGATTFVPVSTLWNVDKKYDATVASTYVDKAQFLNIDNVQLGAFMKADSRGIVLSLPKVDGGVYHINLAQYNFLTGDFKVQAVGNNVAVDHPYTPGIYYRGVVDGIPNSLACFSFFNDEVYGLFSIPGEGNYILALNQITDKSNKLQYILFNDRDSKVHPKGGCDEELLERNRKFINPAALERNAYNTCREIKVFERGDYGFYLTEQSNINAAANYVTACFNALSTVYRNEGIYASMKLFRIDTGNDAYQNASFTTSFDFLNQFGQETQDSLHGTDLAMLLSSLNGTLGGVAWLSTLCSPYNSNGNSGPYSFVNIVKDYVALPSYSFDVEAMTHEMGHNLGSPHTHNCSWPGGAIDGCYTLEGNCAMPVIQYPVNGGTIMSYCHLVAGVGINLSNGFGPLPGNLIRNTVATTSCGNLYTVNKTLSTTSTTLIATRECTMNGMTYYWNDNNTADSSDDRLVLQVKKNGNSIGTLDSAGFSAENVTTAGYSTGTGTLLTFPPGIPAPVQDTTYAMHRFWRLTTTTVPTSNIEIMFPYLQTDRQDLTHSLAAQVAKDSTVYMYLIKTINPNPSLNFIGSVLSSFIFCNPGTTLTPNEWTESISGSMHFAHFLTQSASIGGSGFVTYKKYLATDNVTSPLAQLVFFPNPAKQEWIVNAPYGLDGVALQIFDVRGVRMLTKLLSKNAANHISTNGLASGMYFYRAVGSQIYTGKLVKE